MGGKIIKVAIFAVAFAFMEATVVVYLREIFGFLSPTASQGDVLLTLPGILFLKPDLSLKIIADKGLLDFERMREFTTLVMLACVASLATRRRGQRLAFFFFAFGLWDLFYYIFLKLEIDWPKSLFDPDVFFLLPVPWVGPVIVPIIISLSMVTLLFFKLKRN